MPTIKLQGGLGNQMFQYALAYALSRKYDEPIFYDGRSVLENRFFFADWTFRHYELDVFGIEKDYPVPSYLESRLLHPKVYELPSRYRYKNHYIRESGGKLIADFPRDAYLDGWFQSYRYFDSYEQDIRAIFTVKTPLNAENSSLIDEIKNTTSSSVSLHVRRGDYVTLAGANKWHGVCSIGYYESAIETMIRKIENPVFYIFSDDVTWCRENIHIPDGIRAQFVDHNGSAGHEDLRLMYSCAHHIIANSSFSWWGAYLGRNPEKIIIAPKKWLQTDSFHTENLLPPTWILL